MTPPGKHTHPGRAKLPFRASYLTLGAVLVALAIAVTTLILVLRDRKYPRVPPPVVVTIDRTQIVTRPPVTKTVTATPSMSGTD